jgi:proteasome assembly chaperone (PAC2) family protein
LDVVLKDVKYVPELWVNLFSIGKALAGGFKIGNKGMMLYLIKGSFKMTFDCLMATKKGYVMGIDMVPVAASVATAALERGVQVDINALHKMLSHVGKDATIKTAAYYGWVLKGTWED